jgi:hypothetical protein
MRSTFSIILKNSILLILLVVSIVFILSNNIGFKEIYYLFAGLGFLYIVASCYEAYAIANINTSANKISYITYGFLAKRFIKVIAFTCCGVVLYYAGSIIKYLAFICFLIAFTEVIVIIYRSVKKLSYIAFDGELLIISTNKLNIMHASSVQKIHARHGLTYFVDSQNTSFTIRTDIIQNTALFNQCMDEWIKNNKIEDKVDLS